MRIRTFGSTDGRKNKNDTETAIFSHTWVPSRVVTCDKSPNYNFGQLNRTLTVFPPSVEILHIVIEADPDGGEAQLPLETRNQPIVQGPGALSPDHGADGSEHAPVADALHGLLLSLDLGSQAEVNGSTAIAGGEKHTKFSQACSKKWKCIDWSQGWKTCAV